jgi:hypothetical protein
MARTSLRILLSASLAALSLTALSVPHAWASSPSVWVQDATDRPFTSTTEPSSPPQSIALYAGRNDYEAAQILLRSGSSQTGVSVAVGALAGPGGATISASNVTARYEYNHPSIAKITGIVQNPPDNGSAYYDALMDDSPQSVPGNTTFAYFYQVYVPAGQAPGTYTGSATVNSSLGAVTVPVSVSVYNITIPPTNQSSFKQNNWFTSVGWDYAGTEQAIPAEYGVQIYDANWWKVEANIAANMARHRNNVIYADAEALAIPNSTVDASGNYTFDWSTFDRFVGLFVNAGAMQYIYTPTLIEPGPGNDKTNPQLDTLVPANGVSGALKHVLCPPNSAASGGCADTCPGTPLPTCASYSTIGTGWQCSSCPATPGELNPLEWVWSPIKASLGNLAHRLGGIDELAHLINTRLRQIQYRTDGLLDRYVNDAGHTLEPP